MRFLILTTLWLVLAACGVADVGLSAATTAKLQAEQARQAKETAAQIVQKLEASNQVTERRLADMNEEKH